MFNIIVTTMLLFFGSSSRAEDVYLENPTPKALTDLGTIEGKHFFYDRYSLTNWTSSKTLCASSNMELATIDTEAQFNFLVNSNITSGAYWTDAREARKLRMLSWGSNDRELPSFLGRYFGEVLEDDYYVCGVYTTQPGFIVLDECSERWGVLCQT